MAKAGARVKITLRCSECKQRLTLRLLKKIAS